jgi:hypothetical protein
MAGHSQERQISWISTQTQKNRHTTQTLNIHVLSEIRTHGPGVRVSEDYSCLRPLGYRDRHITLCRPLKINPCTLKMEAKSYETKLPLYQSTECKGKRVKL